MEECWRTMEHPPGPALAIPAAQTGASGSYLPPLPPLVQGLLAAARAHCDSQSVDLVQTHISWVILAGDYAYKLKKPVKLSFLDFSTLDLRRQYCEAELRLNQRYAPDLYLGLIAIRGTPEHPAWEGSGPVLEYAVKMRRFDEAGRLDRVCRRGALTPELVSGLARTVWELHHTAAMAAPDSRFGSPFTIRAQALQNLDDLERFSAEPAWQARLAGLRAWTEQQCETLAPLMCARQQQGLVRECHGDLHLANMVLIDQKVRLFDCLEFSEDLRWIDVASDLAFTYVDLLALQRPGLACWFVNESLLWSGDYASAPLLRFYAVYRALVCAKVAVLRPRQDAARDVAQPDYLALAHGLLAPRPLSLRITHGLSGCGKTHTTSAMLQSDASANTVRLRSDAERKRLFGIGLRQRTGAAPDAGIYGPGESDKTFAQLQAQSKALLAAHWSVLVDGTFLRRVRRDAFRHLADAAGVAFGIVAPQAPPELLRERVRRRQEAEDDFSEATLEVLERQMAALEPLGADEAPWPLPQ